MTKEEREELGIPLHAPVKPIVKRDLDGEIVERYNSCQEAAEKNGISTTAMNNRIKRKSICEGFYFEYVNDSRKFYLPTQENHKVGKKAQETFKRKPYYLMAVKNMNGGIR